MVALVIATIGVSVQQMYCYCLDKTTTSLVTLHASAVPAKQEEASACCKKESAPKPSCCTKKKLSPKKGCTKKTTQVFQLKTEFLVDHPVVEKSFDFPLWINDFPMLRRMARPVICDAAIFHQALPPPPISGRDLCVRHQLALC